MRNSVVVREKITGKGLYYYNEGKAVHSLSTLSLGENKEVPPPFFLFPGRRGIVTRDALGASTTTVFENMGAITPYGFLQLVSQFHEFSYKGYGKHYKSRFSLAKSNIKHSQFEMPNKDPGLSLQRFQKIEFSETLSTKS